MVVMLNLWHFLQCLRPKLLFPVNISQAVPGLKQPTWLLLSSPYSLSSGASYWQTSNRLEAEPCALCWTGMWWANQQTKQFLATDYSRIPLFLQLGSQRKCSTALWIQVLYMFSFSSLVGTNLEPGSGSLNLQDFEEKILKQQNKKFQMCWLVSVFKALFYWELSEHAVLIILPVCLLARQKQLFPKRKNTRSILHSPELQCSQ